MKNTVRHIVLLLLFLLISSYGICWAVSITITGSWAETIDASDLVAGAGSDLIDTYESASDQVYVRIVAVGDRYWRVDVKRIDNNWHADFQLSVRRTSDGTGDGSISGGTSYLAVTDTDQSFFNGYMGRNMIDIQLELSGVSIQIPPDTYTTTVNYTVVEI